MGEDDKTDVTDDVHLQLVREVARLHGRCEGLEQRFDSMQTWLQGELMSVANNVRTNGSELQRLDVMLRGANGDNGLTSRIATLERVEAVRQQSSTRWDLRSWAIVMALLMSLLSVGSHWLKGFI